MAYSTRSRRNKGISPGGKVAILCVVFGIPLLFVLSSYGLSKLFSVAPYAVVAILILVATAYSAQTAGLMYKFYEVDPTPVRFIPCIGELALVDLKWRPACYILYLVSILFLGLSQIPYSVVKLLGDGVALHAPFYLMAIGMVALVIIQILKGIGIAGTMKDIANDWEQVTHVDVGAITKFSLLGFIPFVRIIAIYSLNKPLSTLVEFMGVSVEDTEDDEDFVEEDM